MQHLACQIQEVASAWQDSTHPLYGKPLYKGELWLPENTRWRRAHCQRRLRRGWILVPISVFNSCSCTLLTIPNLVVLNDRTWIIQSRRWWRWGSSKSAWSTDTKWSRGVTWRAWHCFRGSWMWISSFLVTHTNLRLLRMKINFILTLDLPQGHIVHWKGITFTLISSTSCYMQSITCMISDSIVSLQQHHTIICFDGHSSIYSGNVCLSAHWRRRQSRENRIQKVLKSVDRRAAFFQDANLVIPSPERHKCCIITLRYILM